MDQQSTVTASAGAPVAVRKDWSRPRLVAEYNRLQHRKLRLVLSARVRAEEDAQIDELIELLRKK